MSLYIGIAGWTISRDHKKHFPEKGSHLERYAHLFNCVEINSSFYRPHQPKTYARWADSTPDHFRFAVKCPKQITHTNRLLNSESLVEQFFEQVSHLGKKLGPILVQLPPSLRFDHDIAKTFFSMMRGIVSGSIVCEPRHMTWFADDANHVLDALRIGRVAADPAITEAGKVPTGSDEIEYYRWHGSPKIYYSSYSANELEQLAVRLNTDNDGKREQWCIFDNTALGAAIENGLTLQERIQRVNIENKLFAEE
jgi:uncharacterized protein YecE (DUF72 family)